MKTKKRVGINGFGRIGRQLTKLILDSNKNVDLVAINDFQIQILLLTF